jgi:hypothetical protein
MASDATSLAEIEREIDKSFFAILACQDIWKGDANLSLLDVAELLMSGHGAVPEGSKDPVRTYHLNVATGASSALRRVGALGAEQKVAPPAGLRDRMRQMIGACISFGTVEDAFFSHWKGYADVEVAGKKVSFSPTGTELDARLRAFNSSDDLTNEAPPFHSPLENDELQDAFVRSLKRARTRRGVLDYWIETHVLDTVADAYREHTTRWMGAVPDLDLGACTVKDLIVGWSYLRAAASLHQLVSFILAKGSKDIDGLTNPPALHRPIDYWRSVLRLKNWEAVFAALTFRPGEKTADVCITPIVPLWTNYFGIIPRATLRSNVPRNIMVLIASRFQTAYSRFSNGKEDALLGDLEKRCAPLLGSKVSLPKIGGKQLPDIDLLLGSPDKQRIVAAEIKWQLSSSSTREVVSRNDYLKKGAEQLEAIREFLEANLGYLRASRRIAFDLKGGETEYILLCKGHLGNEDVISNGILMCDYDVFVRTLENNGLESAISEAHQFNYLPKLNEDFKLMDINVKFGEWIVSWKTFVPPELTEDDETAIVEDHYRDTLRFLA